jgi:type IV pilus assembly protein PilB
MKLKVGPDRVIDFRVSTLPTLFGEKIVIRILDPSSAKLGIDALGYEPEEKARLLEAIAALRHDSGDRAHGLGQDGVAVHLPEPAEQAGVNIATAEDPSEINLPGVSTRSTSMTKAG